MFKQVDRKQPFGLFLSFINKTLIIPENMLLHTGVLHFSMTSCMALITVITNIYLITYIARTKTTRICKNTCYGYYLLHLCVVEIIMAALSVPFTLVYNSENVKEHEVSMYRIFFIMKRLLCNVCHTTIASMVLQRYLCLKNSMRKRKSIVHLKMSLFVGWFWSMTIMLPQIILYSSPKASEIHENESSVYLIVLMVSILLIPFLVILYCRIGISSLTSTDSVLLIKRCRQYRKFACTCLLLSGILVISNLPEYVCKLLVELQHNNKIQVRVNKGILAITVTLSWIYLPVIPIIYSLAYLIKLKRTREQIPVKDKGTHNNSKYLTHPVEPTKPFHPPTFNRIQLPSHDSGFRRCSMFDRRKSSSSLDGVLDLCSRRFSEPHVDVNAELISSCLTTLESLYEKHTKKKSFLRNTFRRFSDMQHHNEAEVTSSEELSPFPHVVHKLNQRPRISEVLLED